MSTNSNPTSIKSILIILPSTPRSYKTSVLLTLSNRKCCMHFISPCPLRAPPLTQLHLIVLLMSDEKHKLHSSSCISFLQPLFHPSHVKNSPQHPLHTPLICVLLCMWQTKFRSRTRQQVTQQLFCTSVLCFYIADKLLHTAWQGAAYRDIWYQFQNCTTRRTAH
jgi:hypothetical protein